MEIENHELDTDLEFDKAFDELAEGATPEQLDTEAEESVRLRDEQGRFAAEQKEAEQESAALDNKEAQAEPAELTDLDKYKQDNTNWEHRYKSDLGRQNALQSKLAESERTIQELRAGSTAQKPADIPNEQWEELKNDYPEIAAGIEARFGNLEKNHQAEIEALKGQISPIQQEAEAQYVKNQTDALIRDFPDYIQTINSPEFDKWVQAQPRTVQALMGSDEAVDASYLLNSFAQTQQTTQPESPLRTKRKQQLEDAETLSTRNSLKKPDDENDFDSAFNEFAEEA
jgi:hypothetical protein